jgi:hypothetical protein
MSAYGDSSEIIARARDRLSDSDGTIFTNAEMLRHLEVAVAEFSGYRPYRNSTTITTVADQDTYDLPATCLWVDRVYVITADTDVNTLIGDILTDIRDNLYQYDLSRWRDQIRARYQLYGQPSAVEWNNQLLLYPAPTEAGDTINVDYSSIHAKSTAGNYTTLRTKDIQYVEDFLVVRCMKILATDAAKRSAYTEGQSKVDPQNMAKEFREQARLLEAAVKSELSENLVANG